MIRGPKAVMAFAVMLVCGTACDSAPHGPLAELAAEWNGGSSDVRCRDSGPNGENLGPIPGSEYCQWMPADSSHQVIVSGSRLQRRLAAITFTPIIGDSAKAVRDLALVSSTLERRGLHAMVCDKAQLLASGIHGMHWQNASLAVQLTRVAQPTGGQRIVVYATDVPSSVPTGYCTTK